MLPSATSLAKGKKMVLMNTLNTSELGRSLIACVDSDLSLIHIYVEVMEALRMAGGNDALVEEMKLWLLKQQQTTCWNSPVATADDVYALLCQGTNLRCV